MLVAWVGSALSACALPGVEGQVRPPDAAVQRALAGADIVLLGEVHDNPAQHARRVGWLREALAGRRVVLAMEQFDVDRQPLLDAARAQGVTGRALAERAGFSFKGWDWPSYAPAVDLALARDWPLVAANLPARDAMAAARQPGQAPAPPAGWGDREDAAMAKTIREGHCDLLPANMVPAMAAAQRARDARMAQAVAQARADTGLPVVLLAGNGHVRRDLGVPRWLAVLRPQDRVVSVGLLEGPASEADSAGYDLVVSTEAVTRDDPCEGLRQRMSKSR